MKYFSVQYGSKAIRIQTRRAEGLIQLSQAGIVPELPPGWLREAMLVEPDPAGGLLAVYVDKEIVREA